MKGYFVQEFPINTKGDPFYLVSINQYVKLDIDYCSNDKYCNLINKLNQLTHRKIELEEKHWIVPLSQDEKNEYKREAKLIEGKNQIT